MKNQIQKLLVISSYPPKDSTHHEKIVGVASYTKNTLEALPNDAEITVFAETLPGEKNNYTTENIQVQRIWKRNSIWVFPTLFKQILSKHKETTQILIAVEVAMFGGKVALLLLPFFIAMLRLLRKDVTIVIHQVITDIGELSGHVYTYEGISAWITNIVLVLYYKAMLFTASQSIVMDEVLKQRLASLGDSKKILVIPHGVEHFSAVPSQQQAKRTLKIKKDTFVLLYFGFLAWYKGTDMLVKAIQEIPKNKRNNLTLILAGGPNPNHADKPSYMRYIQEIESICQQEGIRVTGFVPEKDIPTYFAASDLVVFPYRTLMSASGPLSMAFSFGKPFLISSSLKSIMRTKDIKECLSRSNVPEESLVITTQKDLIAKIEMMQKNQQKRKKLAMISKEMGMLRAWQTIGKYYTAVLFPQKQKTLSYTLAHI